MDFVTWGEGILPPRPTGLLNISTPSHPHREIWDLLADCGPLTFEEILAKVPLPVTETWREYLRWREIRTRPNPTPAQSQQADREYVQRALDLSLIHGWMTFDGDRYAVNRCPPDHGANRGQSYTVGSVLFAELADQGWTLYDIAEYLGFDKRTLVAWRARAKRVPGKTAPGRQPVLDTRASKVRRANTNTDDVNEMVVALHAEGMTKKEIITAISKKFPGTHLTEKQVYHKLRSAAPPLENVLRYLREERGNEPSGVAMFTKAPSRFGTRSLRSAHVEEWIRNGDLLDASWFRPGYFQAPPVE